MTISDISDSKRMTFFLTVFAWLHFSFVSAFTTRTYKINNRRTISNDTLLQQRQMINDDTIDIMDNNYSNKHHIHHRRQFVSNLMSVPLLSLGVILPTPSYSLAAETTTATVEVDKTTYSTRTPTTRNNNIEMKRFIDPKGLFIINVPNRFFAIRRTIKGDLPDEATGKGRRGSSIFTAGDMAKAEVIAIERFPTKVLLEDEGITPSGDLSTFPSIGDATAIANLITIRRDRDKQTQSRTTVIPNSVSISNDGKTLYFSLLQSIDVQKPELLMEQMGVSELIRMTVAKATLDSNDGQMMVVFASALQQDFDGEDGPALEESVSSFIALDQASSSK